MAAFAARIAAVPQAHRNGLFCATAAVLCGYIYYYGDELVLQQAADRSLQRRADHTPGLVGLHIFPRTGAGSINMSVPCAQLETYLRLAGVPYEAHMDFATAESPNRHFPFVEVNGYALAEPAAIVEALQASGVAPREDLTVDQRSRAVLLRRLVEDSLRWSFKRATLVDNSDCVVDGAAALTPSWVPRWAVKQTVLWSARREALRTLHGTGHMDMSAERYRAEMQCDVAALEHELRRHMFALGDTPTSTDAVLYAHLHAMCAVPAKSLTAPVPALQYLQQSAVVRQYLARVEAAAFPDLREVTMVPEPIGTVRRYGKAVSAAAALPVAVPKLQA